MYSSPPFYSIQNHTLKKHVFFYYFLYLLFPWFESNHSSSLAHNDIEEFFKLHPNHALNTFTIIPKIPIDIIEIHTKMQNYITQFLVTYIFHTKPVIPSFTKLGTFQNTKNHFYLCSSRISICFTCFGLVKKSATTTKEKNSKTIKFFTQRERERERERFYCDERSNGDCDCDCVCEG